MNKATARPGRFVVRCSESSRAFMHAAVPVLLLLASEPARYAFFMRFED